MFEVRSITVALSTLILVSGCWPRRPCHCTEDPATLAAEMAAMESDERESENPPVSDPTAPRRPPPFDALLQGHHHFDLSWVEEAEIIVVATLERGRYPCVWRSNGVRAIPLRTTLVIEQVIHGTLPRGSFDIAFVQDPSDRFPLELHERRRYAVFLRPTEAARAQLANPEFVFSSDTQLEMRELVAMVDLDQTVEEALAHRERAARWQVLEAFELSAESWRQMRESPTAELERTERVLHAIRRSLFPEWTRREAVRSVLGPPDESRPGDGGLTLETYHLDVSARGNPVAGTLYGRLELGFDADGALQTYGEGYDIIDGEALREATYEEYTSRGMTTYGIDRR